MRLVIETTKPSADPIIAGPILANGLHVTFGEQVGLVK